MKERAIYVFFLRKKFLSVISQIAQMFNEHPKVPNHIPGYSGDP